jgi:hypothetical protein
MSVNTNTQLNTSDKSIEDYFSETVTGYGLIKGTNKILADLGVDKTLPTPMGYTYLKKGYVTGEKDVKACSRDEAASWASKYVAKLLGKVVAQESEEAQDVEMTEPLELDI